MIKVYQGYITKFLVQRNNWALALFYIQSTEKLKIKIKGNIAEMQLRQPYEIFGHLEPGANNCIFEVKKFSAIAPTDHKKPKIEQKFHDLNLNFSIYQKIKKIAVDEQELINILKSNFLTWAFNQNLGQIKDLDKIAQAFNQTPNEIERLGVWLTSIVKKIIANTGNTYTDLTTLKNEIKDKYSEFDSQIFNQGLLYAKQQKWLFLVNHKIYSKESWIDENDIVFQLSLLKKSKDKKIILNKIELIKKTEEKVAKLLKNDNFAFDEQQKDCLEKLIENKILIINGGPGVGKSTLILGLAILYRFLKPKAKINITTPTGRASIRLKEIIPDFNPMTIHRLLEFKDDQFHRNAKNYLDSDLIIIDEMSMVDNHLFASLLRATNNLDKLVLVGDINQLPPVNYGDVFSDLVFSKQFTTFHLEHNHRQKQKSGIVLLATAMRENKLKQLDWKKLSRVEFIENENLKDLITLKLDYSSYCNKPNFDVMSYQIIAPVYKGEGGIDFINHTFQFEFNDNFKSKNAIYSHEENNFTIGDKIICNKNLPEYDLANGEIGLIKELKLNNQDLISGIADFGGKNIKLNKELFESFSLCYACSIHKTQGSEYEKVALILNNDMKPNAFLNKKLIYTAITRAKKELLIIGKKELFLEIASKNPVTRLSTILEKINNYQ